MKRLLFLPLLALPLLFLSCDAQTDTLTEPDAPQFSITAQGAATNTVQVQLRCARGVTGSVTVSVYSPGGSYPFYMDCTTNTKDSNTFGFGPGDVDEFSVDDQNWSFGSCGSWKPSLFYTGIPGTKKCYIGLQEKGKTYLTVKVRYIKNP